jgi:2-oxoglutarate ferredoxin oxidoreductase subunit alpha
VSSLGFGKHGNPGPGIEATMQRAADRFRAIAEQETRVETGFVDDADVIVVAFGTAAKFVRYVVGELREEGRRVGFVRPITLAPFPYDAVAEAANGAQTIAVFEINAGQMIDDVRLGVLGRAPVVSIGGISTDHSGFGVGALLDLEVVRARVEQVLAGHEVGV